MAEDTLRMLIPVIALSIPLVAVIGGTIVKPIIEALRRPPPELPDPAEREALIERIDLLEHRLNEMERTVHQVQDAQRFDAQIGAGRGVAAASADPRADRSLPGGITRTADADR